LWGNSATPLTGSVREIAASADPVTRTFTVKADIGRAAVHLGQTASVRIERSAGFGEIQLPLTALFEDQGKTSVWLVDPATMTVSPQPVQLGGAQGNSIVVAAGLRPGQTVVTAGVHVLTPGQKVKLYQEPVATASAN
jgi:RND family efflux transporter MFP subunit